MRLLFALVLVLLLSSCQQRYGHVKRVKADKTQTSRAKEKEKLQADSSALQSYSDTSELTLSGQAEEPDQLQGSLPSPEPGEEGTEKEEKLTPKNKPHLPSYFNKVFPNLPGGTQDEPLTKQEKLLILAIFTIWTLLIVVGVSFLILFLSAEFLIIGLWLGGWSFLFGYFLVTLLLGILLSTLAFFIARSRIRKRIPKQIDAFELVPYFLLVLVLVGLCLKIFSLFPLLLLNLILVIILILAIIYSVRYDRKTNSTD